MRQIVYSLPSSRPAAPSGYRHGETRGRDRDPRAGPGTKGLCRMRTESLTAPSYAQAAQYLEAFVCLAEIGLGLLDDHASFGQSFGRRARNPGDFRINWRNTECCRIGEDLC